MAKGVYPGTFDPPTKGHLDLIERGARLFDELIVAVARNTSKAPLFDEDERAAMLEEATEGIRNVRVSRFGGLIVDFCREEGATYILRGIRTVGDFEYEFAMALTNRSLAADVETVFVMPKEEYSYTSSSLMKEIVRMGGDVSPFVTAPVIERMRAKLGAPPGKAAAPRRRSGRRRKR